MVANVVQPSKGSGVYNRALYLKDRRSALEVWQSYLTGPFQGEALGHKEPLRRAGTLLRSSVAADAVMLT
jgi:hypothetical protein